MNIQIPVLLLRTNHPRNIEIVNNEQMGGSVRQEVVEQDGSLVEDRVVWAAGLSAMGVA